jgi:hypothetical protein
MTKGTKKMMTGGMANPNAKANLETYSPESRTKASTTMSDAKLAKKGGMMGKKQIGGPTTMTPTIKKSSLPKKPSLKKRTENFNIEYGKNLKPGEYRRKERIENRAVRKSMEMKNGGKKK